MNDRNRNGAGSSDLPPPRDLTAETFTLGNLELVVLEYPVQTGTIPSELSPAERSIVQSLFEGLTTKQIAAQRGVSRRTVSNQLASIYRRLRVSSRTELLAALLK